jgi:hypothetical protein
MEVRRLHRRGDKVEKGARFRGRMMTRRMQRIQRKSLIKPIREDDLQTSILNQRLDSKFQELCNTVTSEADCVKGPNIAEQELRVRVDFDFLTALPECRAGPSCAGVCRALGVPTWSRGVRRLVSF